MKKISVTMLALVLVLSACEEENPLEGFLEIQKELAQRYLQTEANLTNTYRLVHQVMTKGIMPGDTLNLQGAAVYRAASKIVMDYGNGGVGDDGRVRTGKLLLEETGDYFQQNGSLQVDFEDYTVDKVPMGGSFLVTNGGGADLQLSINNFSLNNAFSLSGNKSLRWAQGFTTEVEDDDVFGISGKVNAEDNDKNTVDAQVSEEVMLDANCKHRIVSGLFDLEFGVAQDSSGTESTGSIDFIAEDGCENLVKINLNDGNSAVSLTSQFSGF